MTNYLTVVNSQFAYQAFFGSGIIWIPYSILMYSLYREHQQRKKFPQNVILWLLTANVIIRCIWFFLYPQYATEIIMVVMNRVAILLQFSALSILILMWVRALEITSLANKMSKAETLALNQQSQRAGSNMPSSERPRSLKSSHNDALLRLEAEKKQRIYIRGVLLFNLVIWAVILGSLADDSVQWYHINLIAISLMCWIEACITLVIGLRTALALQKELSATLAISNADLNQGQHRVETGWKGALYCLCCCTCLGPFYRLFFASKRKGQSQYGLQIQRDVVKTILTVSVIVFFFFFLRSLAFLNRPILEG
jgi:hypothetical protein